MVVDVGGKLTTYGLQLSLNSPLNFTIGMLWQLVMFHAACDLCNGSLKHVHAHVWQTIHITMHEPSSPLHA
jgi:hypothetical protein